ncbi:hypothetical protein GWI33_007490 [Rhynchophorus ferrugineus]|uniref:Uncharacterized protein n=1 Tax=Rhynchophorus ferrugineus TaxID=354439 RepID=A0A834MCZ9_RHYFE|nr:hypothetical protein GWI33_007490 [Rhynchophorus ferrugineus]
MILLIKRLKAIYGFSDAHKIVKYPNPLSATGPINQENFIPIPSFPIPPHLSINNSYKLGVVSEGGAESEEHKEPSESYNNRLSQLELSCPIRDHHVKLENETYGVKNMVMEYLAK